MFLPPPSLPPSLTPSLPPSLPPPTLPPRFSHELSRGYSSSAARCAKLSSAVRCVQRARERAAHLRDKLARERTALLEKTKVH